MGKLQDLPQTIQEKIQRNVYETEKNQGLILTLALSYSSRLEITDAAKRLCEQVKQGTLKTEDITESHLANQLYTSGMPDPDLLIRTSGELRVSNFLLWQISYTEIYVSQKYWPDFKEEDFLEAVSAYQKRERRFGRTEKANAAK